MGQHQGMGRERSQGVQSREECSRWCRRRGYATCKGKGRKRGLEMVRQARKASVKN